MDREDRKTEVPLPEQLQLEPGHPKPSLWEEIGKGWEWVVFSWQMLRSIGGPVAIARTLGSVLCLLLKRTLVQWGLIKPRVK